MWCCWIVDLWPRPGGPWRRTGVDRGGTERALAEAGLLVTAVSDVTGFPGWRQRGARRIAAGRHETAADGRGMDRAVARGRIRREGELSRPLVRAHGPDPRVDGRNRRTRLQGARGRSTAFRWFWR